MEFLEKFHGGILVDTEKADKKEILDRAIESVKKIEEVVKEAKLAFSFEGSDLDEFIKTRVEEALGIGGMVHWEIESEESEGFVVQVLLTAEETKNGNFEADSLFTLSVGDIEEDPSIQIFVSFSAREKNWETYYYPLGESEPSPEIKTLLSKLDINTAETVVSEEEALKKIKGLCEFMQSKLVEDSN